MDRRDHPVKIEQGVKTLKKEKRRRLEEPPRDRCLEKELAGNRKRAARPDLATECGRRKSANAARS